MRNRWVVAWFGIPAVAWVLMWATACSAQPVPFAAPTSTTAIVAVHGGGWYGGTPASMDKVCDALAPALGVDCFQPSYTLSGVAPFSRQLQDLRDYALGLRAQGYTTLIGVGSSAGGNLVGLMASHGYLDLAVTLSAPSQLVVLEDWHRASCSCWVVDQYAPTAGKKENASPALDGVSIPILIIHSANEPLIPVKQAWYLRTASPQGQRITLSGDRHGMAYWADVSDDIITWLSPQLPTAG